MKLKTLFLFISLPLAGLPLLGQTAAETHAFADSLYSAGRLSQALPVYQRAAFFMRPVVDPEVLCRIADCFYDTGDFEKALEFYDHSYFAQPDDSIKKEVLFRKSACYLRTHNYNFALMELLNLDDSLSPGFDARRNFYLGMAWYGLEDFTKAGDYFEKAAPDPQKRQEIHEIFANQKKFYRPKPRLASWLSVFVPGAGQIYSGEVTAGINSLVLTGFFVGLGFYIATVTSPVDALFTALPWFQRYYQGGFQRAADFARIKRAANRNLIFNELLPLMEAKQ
jgi:TM2 domain-containing membrane protein YozV